MRGAEEGFSAENHRPYPVSTARTDGPGRGAAAFHIPAKPFCDQKIKHPLAGFVNADISPVPCCLAAVRTMG
jgi:hypothetical protein